MSDLGLSAIDENTDDVPEADVPVDDSEVADGGEQ